MNMLNSNTKDAEYSSYRRVLNRSSTMEVERDALNAKHSGR